MRSSYFKYLVVFALLLGTLFSCAPVKWMAIVEKKAELVWPAPPDIPRIKYLGELSAFVPSGESFFTKLFGKGSSGEIIKPVAVAIGGDGRMAIADSSLAGVHLFLPQEKKYLLIKGSDPQEKFLAPVSVVFNGDMQLYIADAELQKVFIYDHNGSFVKSIDSAGYNKFKRPTGLCVNLVANILYVIDTVAHKVFIFNENEEMLGSFGGRGKGVGEFNFPTHITTDLLGRVYVNDAMNFRIQVFDQEGSFINKFGNHGNGTGDFAMTKGVAVGKDGVYYIVDTLFDRVQFFDKQGRYLLAFGGKGDKPGEFWLPSGIYHDYRNDKLYVCDTYNQKIQIFQVVASNGGLK